MEATIKETAQEEPFQGQIDRDKAEEASVLISTGQRTLNQIRISFGLSPLSYELADEYLVLEKHD
jgi:hypothetical protein